MKILIQKIHLEEQHSFACRKYETPQFETNWHKHDEFELILITEGNGTALIGDYVGAYTEGDVFFIAANVPHWFRKADSKMKGGAIVAHFLKTFLGSTFLNLPEIEKLQHLLDSENIGLQLQNTLQKNVALGITQIEKSVGMDRVLKLLHCLKLISYSKEYQMVNNSLDTDATTNENSTIEKIFQFSYQHFLEPIALTEVADVVGMSIPTFCRFFKRNIKKSYFDFLKELRIAHACKLLRESNDAILDVCYNSGYNSWAHFSKQFKNVKQITPNQYRKQFKTD